MASSHQPGLHDRYTDIRNLRWSPAERTLARRVFGISLQKELESVIRETKQMAGEIAEPSDLWELESFLTRRRKQIDRKYDFRYSMLIFVFGLLLRERRVSEKDLNGLSEDKLERIRKYAKL